MIRRILVLEDDPERIATFRDYLGHHELLIVNQAAQAIDSMFDAVGTGIPFEVIFLDHDLGGLTHVPTTELNTGSEVVRWMRQYEQLIKSDPTIVIHSLNESAADGMLVDLQLKYSRVYRLPFTILVKHLKNLAFIS